MARWVIVCLAVLLTVACSAKRSAAPTILWTESRIAGEPPTPAKQPRANIGKSAPPRAAQRDRLRSIIEAPADAPPVAADPQTAATGPQAVGTTGTVMPHARGEEPVGSTGVSPDASAVPPGGNDPPSGPHTPMLSRSSAASAFRGILGGALLAFAALAAVLLARHYTRSHTHS